MVGQEDTIDPDHVAWFDHLFSIDGDKVKPLRPGPDGRNIVEPFAFISADLNVCSDQEQTVPKMWGTYVMFPRVMGDYSSESDVGPGPDTKVLAEGKPFIFCVGPHESHRRTTPGATILPVPLCPESDRKRMPRRWEFANVALPRS